ncbi:hypothetical protein IAU60_005767 [Kwoniella sp. DSM 27419]
MSRLSASALGLTDSPLPALPPSTRSDLPTSIPVRQAGIKGRPSQSYLRPAPSKPNLRQEATTNAAARAAQSSIDLASRIVPPRSSRTNLRGQGGGGVGEAGRPISRTGQDSVSLPKPDSALSKVVPVTAVRTSNRPSPQSQSRMAPRKAKTTTYRKPPPSPAGTEKSFAEEWEEELVQNAKRLDLNPRPASVTVSRARKELTLDARDQEERRGRDAKWERSGAWEDGRDVARAQEQTERQRAVRDQAYPPATPRSAIRAAPWGVTSVHVGVRPRLHPSRASDSMVRNQPDENIPSPLFSPSVSDSALPSETVTRVKRNGLLDKAQKEYEAWLARKAEREGGPEEEGGGTRDWKPKYREVARPGAVEGIAHSDEYRERNPAAMGYMDPMVDQHMQAMQMSAAGVSTPVASDPRPPKARVAEPKLAEHANTTPSKAGKSTQPVDNLYEQKPMDPWAYPYPEGYQSQQFTGGYVPIQGYWPDHAYWDPSYWWGRRGMGERFPDQTQQPPMTSGFQSARRVQFADTQSGTETQNGSIASGLATPDYSYGEA